jgi:Rrf2 family protein
MRISSKAEYGLRALLDLAQRYGDGPIQSRDIHERQQIDENYLNQILIMLRKSGLIESLRGPQGGHRLARPPAQITLFEALIALEGPLLSNDLANADDGPPSLDRAVVRDVWSQMRDVLHSHLSNVTLDDLCQRRRQHAGDVMYYI